MKTALDTNILVGLALGATDRSRFEKSRDAVSRALADGHELEVTECVLCETVWVLESRYGLPRATVARRLGEIVGTPEVRGWDETLAAAALALLAGEPALDVADCILAARAALTDGAVLTFDRHLEKVMRGVEVVEI